MQGHRVQMGELRRWPRHSLSREDAIGWLGDNVFCERYEGPEGGVP